MNERTPKYMIGVAASLVGMHPQTLRMYEARGLVRPRRTPGGTRLYSDADLDRLRRVTELATGMNLSLQGAEHVLALEDRISALQERCRALEKDVREAERRADAAVAQVHASYRRDIVLYRPPEQALVPFRRSPTTHRNE